MTKLIIAQRISSVMEADQIIVMEGGRIADVGRHEELLERCVPYQEIYYSQVSEKEDGGRAADSGRSANDEKEAVAVREKTMVAGGAK